MTAVVADTHTVVWYLRGSPKLSEQALMALNEATRMGLPIHISAISIVEMIYLVEKERIPGGALNQVFESFSDTNSSFVVEPLSLTIAQALAQIPKDQVPDMPDRIIAATALSLNLPLVTRDHKILATSVIQTIW
jgi:PIN domain nuclease of toxin-antitoxin system